jgi:hypothetical protein
VILAKLRDVAVESRRGQNLSVLIGSARARLAGWVGKAAGQGGSSELHYYFRVLTTPPGFAQESFQY